MPDELIDWLDSSGNPIGTIMKSKAHLIRAWHKAIHVYIVNDRNELLLQLRSKDKDMFPDKWDISCGGHVGAGETTLHTALREVMEELGLTIPEKDMHYLFTYPETLTWGEFSSSEFVDVFLVRPFRINDGVTLQESEVAEAKFVPLETFYQMINQQEKCLVPHWEEFEKIIPILKQKM